MKPRILFMGTSTFAAAILHRLVQDGHTVVAAVSQQDKPSGRKMRLVPTPVKEAAHTSGIPVHQPLSVRDAAFADYLADTAPDLIVTAAYGKILPASVLNYPRYGCLNVHGSLLPRYRGAAPVQWALLDGEKETGVTIIRMDTGIDTGEIYAARSIPIADDTDAVQLMDDLSQLGAQLLSEILPDYISGTLTPTRQDEASASYAPMIRKEQGVIHWTQTAHEIGCLVRGLAIWPGTHTFLNGLRYKIHAASPMTEEIQPTTTEPTESLRSATAISTHNPESGSILKATGKDLIVACGDGTRLRIQKLQPQSGRIMDASECAHNFRVGDVFTPESARESIGAAT